MKEVAVSQAVMGSLTNPQVRDFATSMVTDHTAANNELMALAASKGVVEPGAVLERGAALAPEMCVSIGHPAIDLAGSACKITIGVSGKHLEGAVLSGIADSLGDLARMLEDR